MVVYTLNIMHINHINNRERTNELLEKQLNYNTTLKKSNMERIKELKKLLDMGMIPQEEYDAKKKDLLK